MFTSDTKNATGKIILAYSTAAIFCFIFQLVYGQFSHGVSSNYMTFAFVIPLLSGASSIAGIYIFGRKCSGLFCQLIGGAAIWFTLGCIFSGVLEIYGTTNHLTIVFLIAGIAQLVAALIDVILQ